MIKRRDFLRLLPAGAGALALAGCGGGQKEEAAAGFELDCSYKLDYAEQFSADYYKDGSVLLTIGGTDKFLILPENGQAPQDSPEGAVILQRPIENIYLVSSSVMDMFVNLDALEHIRLSGTKADGWYLPEAKQAMEAGEIVYAGKYSAPDYERILAENCGLAIENTMIYHTPEVKEELEQFGIPVMVERSSYESGPLARMEWIKFYGILLGLEAEAESIFSAKLSELEPVLDAEPTGKTAAFFSITSNNLATVRKGGDYVAKMIELAGGSYVFADLTDDGNSLATMNIPLESFYASAHDADVLIYNSTMENEIETIEQLTAKCEMLADFKAVREKSVWCATKDLFQHSMEMSDLMADMNLIFTSGHDADAQLRFLQPVK